MNLFLFKYAIGLEAMLINRMKFFVLIASVLLSDYFFINESIRLNTLSMALLVVSYASYILIGSPIKLRQDTWTILIFCFLFLGYMFIIDIVREQNLYKSTVSFLSSILIIMMLPIFEDKRWQRYFNLIKNYKYLIFISMAFIIPQLAGFNLILIDIFPGIGPLGADRIIEDRSSSFFVRTSGATSNVIAFTSQLVALILINYISWIKTYRLNAIIGLFIVSFALITTQTRAAILSLIPVLSMIQILQAQHRMREVLRIVGLLIIVGLGYWLLSDLILNHMGYLSKEVDSGDTYRFWVNWYISIGVFNESPLFGITPDQAWDIYLRYGDLTIYKYNPDIDVPLHHNQLGYYFRYYGLIGISFLIIIYRFIFIKIMRTKSFSIRLLIGSLFLLDFVYSLAHNNRLFNSPLLWIFLSLASINLVTEKEPM